MRLYLDLLHAHAEIDDRFAPAEDAEIRWRNDFNEWLDRPSRRLFVAVERGQVCGFVTAERWAPIPVFRLSTEIYVDELYVAPECRRKGLGRALLQAVREWAESLGAEGLRAGMLAANEDAAAFWKAVGGEPISVTIGVDLRSGKMGEDDRKSSRAKLGF